MNLVEMNEMTSQEEVVEVAAATEELSVEEVSEVAAKQEEAGETEVVAEVETSPETEAAPEEEAAATEEAPEEVTKIIFSNSTRRGVDIQHSLLRGQSFSFITTITTPLEGKMAKPRY